MVHGLPFVRNERADRSPALTFVSGFLMRSFRAGCHLCSEFGRPRAALYGKHHPLVACTQMGGSYARRRHSTRCLTTAVVLLAVAALLGVVQPNVAHGSYPTLVQPASSAAGHRDGAIGTVVVTRGVPRDHTARNRYPQPPPCFSAFPGARSKRVGRSLLYNYQESVEQVLCNGFGRRTAADFPVSAALACSLVATAAGVVGSKLSNPDLKGTELYATGTCSVIELASDAPLLEKFVSQACSWASTILGRTPAVAWGYIGGVACAVAPALGGGIATYWENHHEAAVAHDITAHQRCLEWVVGHFGNSWKAITCDPRDTGFRGLALARKAPPPPPPPPPPAPPPLGTGGASTSPPFNECPPIGADTGCSVLIIIAPDGSQSLLTDPGQPAYDSIDDTTVGVLDRSSSVVPQIALSGPDIFDFDGDGLCADSLAPAGCPFGGTGYEGPGTLLSADPGTYDSGTVSFPTGLRPGDSTYFSLEGPATSLVAQPPSISNLVVVGTSAEQATLNATIDPGGAGTTYYVEYGLDGTYGETTSAASLTPTPSEKPGSDGQAVEVELTGLNPGTTYHFRFVASNAKGTTYGTDATLTTPSS